MRKIILVLIKPFIFVFLPLRNLTIAHTWVIIWQLMCLTLKVVTMLFFNARFANWLFRRNYCFAKLSVWENEHSSLKGFPEKWHYICSHRELKDMGCYKPKKCGRFKAWQVDIEKEEKRRKSGYYKKIRKEVERNNQ